MRITGRDKACGTAFSYRVDKIDFLITEVCPEVGEKEEEEASMAYIAIATYTLSTNSLTPACVYTLPNSISLSAPVRDILHGIYCSKSAIVLWAFAKAFSSHYFFLFGVLIVLARQGFFKGGLAFCFKVSRDKSEEQ